jgi:hypothetical protein
MIDGVSLLVETKESQKRRVGMVFVREHADPIGLATCIYSTANHPL